MKTRTTPRPDRAAKKTVADRLWKAGDALVVTAALGGGWWWYANRLPAVTFPADAPPVRAQAGGAYARLVAAGESVPDAGRVADAIDRPDRQLERLGRVVSAAEKEAVVAENAAALATLRAALDSGDPVLPPAGPTTSDWKNDYKPYGKVRGLARLLRLEGMTRAERGEWGAAAESHIDAMRLGTAMQARSHLLPSLVGMACESIGRRPLWGMVDRLSAAEARAAAVRVASLDAARPSAAVMLTQEKWATQRALLGEFRVYTLSRMAVSLLEGDRDATDPLSDVQRFGTAAASLAQPKTAVLAEYGRYMDDWAALASLPHRPSGGEPRPARGLIPGQLVPAPAQALHKHRDVAAQTALLAAALALRAYQAEHGGAPPASLRELVTGGYLSRVPADPFAPTADVPLRYAVRPDATPRLYSVGPDGKDDGGVPLDNRYRDGKYKPWAERDSKGDYVVGVNLHSGPY